MLGGLKLQPTWWWVDELRPGPCPTFAGWLPWLPETPVVKRGPWCTGIMGSSLGAAGPWKAAALVCCPQVALRIRPLSDTELEEGATVTAHKVGDQVRLRGARACNHGVGMLTFCMRFTDLLRLKRAPGAEGHSGVCGDPCSLESLRRWLSRVAGVTWQNECQMWGKTDFVRGIGFFHLSLERQL